MTKLFNQDCLALFSGLGSLGVLGADLKDIGRSGVCDVGRLSFLSCSRRVGMLTKLPGC
jgi:hypothetical protein